MRKCIALIICAVLLSGCNRNDSDINGAMELRQRMIHAESMQFSCNITADYFDCIYTFSLKCLYETNGKLSFTVVEPESIAGITGYFDQEGGNLTFDNQVLAFPMLADGELSPVSAPWLFVKTMCYGYIRGSGVSEDKIQFIIDDSYEADSIQAYIWTDLDYQPVSCEFQWQGRRILSTEIENFSLV